MRGSMLIQLGLWLCLGLGGGALAASMTERVIRLEHIHINIHDHAAIKRGALFFKRHCFSCHSMKYLRYDKRSQQAGIVYDAMPVHDAQSWQGHPPPDLSLAARVHRPDWLYTYLQSFYIDRTRALGSNNLALPNSAMPNPFLGVQGQQFLRPNWAHLVAGSRKPQWFELLVLKKQGSLTPGEFHHTIRDVVAYLVYAADPHRQEREQLGYKVLGFLALFFLFALALKQAYWQDIKPRKRR
jgi:ubiquinol-cytochrome c reductase cytochrome c1 subunit